MLEPACVTQVIARQQIDNMAHGMDYSGKAPHTLKINVGNNWGNIGELDTGRMKN